MGAPAAHLSGLEFQMSLLSTIRAGLNTFKTAAAKIEAGAKAVYDALPAFLHPTIDELVSVAKQGASDAVAAADKAEGPVISAASDGLSALIRTAAAKYVGDTEAVVLTAPVADGISRIKDALIADIHAECLYIMSELAQGNPVPSPTDQTKALVGQAK